MSKEPQVAPAAADRDRVTGALETLAQVVLGKEFAALRQEMSEQNTSLFRRIEAIREESSRALEQTRDESRTDLEEVVQEFSAKDTELRKALSDASRELDGRLADSRQALTKEIDQRDQRVGERIESLSRDLAAVQFELQQLAESSQRVSAVLGSLAGVLSSSPLAALATTVTPVASGPKVSTAEMENAVDKLFEKGA